MYPQCFLVQLMLDDLYMGRHATDKYQYINNQTSFTISDNYRRNLLSTVTNAPQNCLPKFCGIIFQISVNNYRNGKLLPKWNYGYLCFYTAKH